jgi:hypothetical protein
MKSFITLFTLLDVVFAEHTSMLGHFDGIQHHSQSRYKRLLDYKLSDDSFTKSEASVDYFFGVILG